jgi:phosphoribosylaminoimidazole-succinocarboxamide synthase
VLTQLSFFWFDNRGVLPTHVITSNVDEYPDPLPRFRSQLRAGRCWCGAEMLDVECVARGYLSGSG